MGKAKGPAYRATRYERVVQGDITWEFIPGEVYDDVPESLVEALAGPYGLLVEEDA